MILTNELPRFTDASGALASRFVILVLTNSFYGREDPRLTDKLLEEAPGIFNWALDGLDRLNERGHFVQPRVGEEALRQLEDLASPVSAFVRDRCRVAPDSTVDKDELWKAWKEWCDEEGARPGTKAVFVRDLRAAFPGIQPGRRRTTAEAREHVLFGVALRGGETMGTTPATPAQSGFEPPETPSGQGWQGSSPSLAVPGRRDLAPIVIFGDDGYLELLDRALEGGHITKKERRKRRLLHFRIRGAEAAAA